MFNLDEIEKDTIVKAIVFNRVNINTTARALGVSRPNLYYRIKKHRICLSSIRTNLQAMYAEFFLPKVQAVDNSLLPTGYGNL